LHGPNDFGKTGAAALYSAAADVALDTEDRPATLVVVADLAASNNAACIVCRIRESRRRNATRAGKSSIFLPIVIRPASANMRADVEASPVVGDWRGNYRGFGVCSGW